MSVKQLVRKGSCNQCGNCCTFPQPCPRLKDKRCSTYAKRPTECALFPRHPYEAGYDSKVCGYKFYDAETGEDIPSLPPNIVPVMIDKSDRPVIFDYQALQP